MRLPTLFTLIDFIKAWNPFAKKEKESNTKADCTRVVHNSVADYKNRVYKVFNSKWELISTIPMKED